MAGIRLENLFLVFASAVIPRVKRKCGKGEFMVSVSFFIGRKKKPFSSLVEDLNAYRLCTFWSLVEVEKNHILRSEMSILCVDEFASVQCSSDV